MPLGAGSPKTVAERKESGERRWKARQTIGLRDHEWELAKRDGRDRGQSASEFLALVYRNWRVSQWELRLLPPLVREPWREK